MLDWENLFKRYVWDHRTTPYLIPVNRLKRQQADYEILAYSDFIGILFGVVSITALTDVGPQGRSPNMSLYALSVTFASVIPIIRTNSKNAVNDLAAHIVFVFSSRYMYGTTNNNKWASSCTIDGT